MVPSAVVQLQRSSWSAPVLRKVADVGNTHYGVHESLNLLGNSLSVRNLLMTIAVARKSAPVICF